MILKNKKITFLFIWILLCLSLFSQESYFQQALDYKIRLRLNDVEHSLKGDIRIVYKNNSPDVLDKIGIHLWPNAYKNKMTAFAKQKIKNKDTQFFDATEDQLGFIDSLNFYVNGTQAQLEYISENPDMSWLWLPSVLLPGDSLVIETPFYVKLPESFSRLGHAGQTYQITQWYPKPAVYDRKGWHLMPYLDQGEFYSEFGNFEVEITLPKNYIVGATGDLQNEDEKQFLYKRVQETKDAIALANTIPTLQNPLSDPDFKTLRYSAENVHDFAWFADKTFYVQKSEVILQSGKKIETWTMFNDLDLWSESIEYVNRSLGFYSHNVGEYPWPQMTAVESALSAGGGMEYPMITVIGPSYTKQILDRIITHEVGHNWFYGILASNERDHPYMDEGLNSFYEQRYMNTYYSSNPLIYLPKFINIILEGYKIEQILYLILARQFNDQYPNQHSSRFTSLNYGNDVYFKTAFLFNYAEKSLDDAEFDNLIKKYYHQWKFKHPYPEDLQKIFSEHASKNTSWLFDGFLNSDQKMDYGICGISKKEDQFTLSIYNKGKIDAPFTISGMKDGKPVLEKWIDGFKNKKDIAFPIGDYDYMAIDIHDETYDLYDCNNYIRTRGVFKKIEPIRIKAFPFLDKNGQTDIGITPVIGKNVYNGLMAGLFFNGPWLPPKNWTLNFLPFYGFKNKQLAGQSTLKYIWYFPEKKISSLSGSIESKYYAYDRLLNQDLNYFQINSQLKIDFKHTPSENIKSELSLKEFRIRDEFLSFKDSISFIDYITRKSYQLQYKFEKQSILGNFSMESSLDYLNQSFKSDLKQQLLRMQISITKSFRYKPERYFNVRAYMAFYPINTERHSSYISSRSSPNFYRGSTGLSYQNYLDDNNEEFFLGRSETEGIWAQQISLNQGGFKLVHGASQRSNLGNTNHFLCSVNLSTELPIKSIGKFIRPYFDIGYYEQKNQTSKEKLVYSGGINLRIVPGIFELYLPLFHSKNISDIYQSNSGHNYWKEISFSLKLKKPEMIDIIHWMGY